MKKITVESAIQLINQTNGRIFSVVFMKKDGTIRDMNCRLGVVKHLKGGELKYDPKDYGLITVFDVQSKGYRMINVDTLMRVSVDGQEFKVVQ